MHTAQWTDLLAFVLLASPFLACTLLDARRARGCPHRVAVWQTSWVNFALFFWLLLVGLVLSGQLAQFIIALIPGANTSFAWRTAIAAASMHLTFVGILSLGWKSRSNSFPPPPDIHKSGALSAIRQGIFLFFAGLPLIWLTAAGWGGVLSIWRHLKLPVNVEPQQLVTLIQSLEEPIPLAILIFVAVILAPISEELIFRGGLYRYFKGHFSATTALVASSLLFALLHFNTASFLPLFALSALFTRAYERADNILVPITFHACFNAMSLILMRVTNAYPSEVPLNSFLPNLLFLQ